jgi:putative heme-binding domain-containing protein
MRALHRVFSLLFFVVAVRAQPAANTVPPNPVPKGNADAVVQQGKALFQIHCSYCHGANGEGGRGADLTTGQYRHGGSDANLYSTVRNGIPGTEMPAVRATDDEVWMMVAFVKRLGAFAPAEQASGDIAAGKAVFEGKGRCTGCHAVGREGGSLGPDLSDVGRRRNLKYLEESILAPEADIPVRYRAVQVVTKSGQTVTGTRLNEDDISIQMRDTRGELRSFLKENIRELRQDGPPLMPAYGKTLDKKEIENVVAYLNSLRGER